MENTAINRFVRLANELVAELESAIEKQGPHSRNDPNADVALKKIRSWRDLALAGTLPGSDHPNFGISRSSLTFGNVEERMYELENLYIDKIRDFRS